MYRIPADAQPFGGCTGFERKHRILADAQDSGGCCWLLLLLAAGRCAAGSWLLLLMLAAGTWPAGCGTVSDRGLVRLRRRGMVVVMWWCGAGGAGDEFHLCDSELLSNAPKYTRGQL